MAKAERLAPPIPSRSSLNDLLNGGTGSDSWRAQADEVKLQIRLGQMEGRGAGLHAVDELDRAGHTPSLP